MIKYVAAVVIAVTLAQPAAAITFPSLTTIYVASGVLDFGGGGHGGLTTSVNCSIVSGKTAPMRVLILDRAGAFDASQTETLPHGATRVFSTHDTLMFNDILLETGFTHGVLNVESTQSGVFCTAMIIDGTAIHNGAALNLVRINPHPGSVE